MGKKANTVNQQQKIAIKNSNIKKIETEKELSDLKQELTDSKTSCSEKAQSMTELQEKNQKLEDELAAARQSDDKNKISQLEKDVEEQKENVKKIQSDLAVVEAEKTKLGEKIKTFEDSFASHYRSHFNLQN